MDQEVRSFSGPLTLEEIKLALSRTKPASMIKRRASISDMIPSRNIYADYPKLDMWHKLKLFNKSDDSDLMIIGQCVSDSSIMETTNNDSNAENFNYTSEEVDLTDDGDIQTDNKCKIRKICTDSLIVISDEDDVDMSSNSLQSSSDLHENSTMEVDEGIDISNSANTDTETTKFNDTLEEMEMFLKHAPKLTKEEERISPEKSEEFFKKPTSKIPVSAKKNVQKATNPTIQKVAKYNDVVSPVAMYIQNSPHVPQRQNVPAKVKLQRNLIQTLPSPRTASPDKFGLPMLIYAPPRAIVKNTETPRKLPVNIQRHLPTIPQISKHVGRAEEKENDNVEEKLLSNDLSMSNLGDLNSTVPLQEISVHQCKDAYMLPTKR